MKKYVALVGAIFSAGASASNEPADQKHRRSQAVAHSAASAPTAEETRAAHNAAWEAPQAAGATWDAYVPLPPLTKQEIITAVKENKEVKMFLANCGNENLQYLLVPSRLNHALSVLDKDGDDEIDANEWEDAIAKALQKKLEQRRAMREANAEAFRKEIEEFTANFLNAAREAFALIDKDDSGSLSKTEIVRAVREDRPVIDFLRNCGEENLQFLLQPARLEKALAQLDTDNSGEVDVDEWEEAIYRGLAKRVEQLQAEQERRMRAAAAADEEFSAEFLTMARAVFDMIDKDQSGTLTKKEIVDAVRGPRPS